MPRLGASAPPSWSTTRSTNGDVASWSKTQTEEQSRSISVRTAVARPPPRATSCGVQLASAPARDRRRGRERVDVLGTPSAVGERQGDRASKRQRGLRCPPRPSGHKADGQSASGGSAGAPTSSSSSDWVEIEVTDVAGEEALVELVTAAAQTHSPPPGEALRPPPRGEELARRRHFHLQVGFQSQLQSVWWRASARARPPSSCSSCLPRIRVVLPRGR